MLQTRGFIHLKVFEFKLNRDIDEGGGVMFFEEVQF